MGFKGWAIRAPESKKRLFASQNGRQSRWVGGWRFKSTQRFSLPGGHSSSRDNVLHLHLSTIICICGQSVSDTPQLVFNQPGVCGESLIPFRLIQSYGQGLAEAQRLKCQEKISVSTPSVWMASVRSRLKKGRGSDEMTPLQVWRALGSAWREST